MTSRTVAPLAGPPAGQAWRFHYAAAGQPIAVRNVSSAGTALTYLFRDHLGSTRAAADPNGTVTARQSYYPYGQVRTSTGSLPTERTFTGQVIDADSTGLLFFNARYYDGALGRFISADTLVPQPGNPQSLNRYSFVLNAPTKYTDPSGHAQATEEGLSTARQWVVSKLLIRNNELARAVEAGKITDLEAFARLAEYAASFYPDCSACLINNLGSVLTGHSHYGFTMSEVTAQAGLIEYDAAYKKAIALQQSGYASIFQDPGAGGNQAHHFWYYVQVGYTNNDVVANSAVVLHETLIANQQAGKSFQDVALGGEGVRLGNALDNGSIAPTEVGDYIRQVLSPDSAEARRWEAEYRNNYWVWGVWFR